MKLPNRHGTGVDPVPFVVVAGTAFMLVYSYLPLYLMAFDVSVTGAVLAATAVWVWIALGAYHRLVWTFRPEYREHVPAGARFRRLIYAALVAVAVVVLLALPLVVR
ncbi:MAG: hypothetical protein V5A23_04755 [Halobacteriales archaeon]